MSLFGCNSKKISFSTDDNSPAMDFRFPEVKNRYYNDALAFLEAQQYAQAEKAFLSAIDELKAQGLPDRELQIAAVENKLGEMYTDLERYRDGYDYLMRAYITYRDRYGESAEWTLLAKTGLCLYDQAVGNYELAIAALQDIHKQTRSDAGKVRTAILLGTVYMNQSDYKSAESWYEKALELGGKLEDSDLCDLYNNYGVLYMHAGDWEKSLAYFQKALQEAESHDESRLRRTVLLNIAQVYTRMGDAESANELITALIADDSVQYGARSLSVGYDYLAVSGLYQMMFDLENQLRSLHTAMDILLETEGENSHVMSLIYGELGTYYYRIGNDQLAISYMNKSIEIKKNILEEKSDQARLAYANLGTFLLETDVQAAIEAYQHEYEIAVYLFGENDSRTGEALIDLANASVKLGNLEAAGQYAEEGISILRKNKIDTGFAAGTAYMILGELYAAEGKGDQAKNAWYKSLELFENAAYKDPAIVSICWYLGNLCLDEGNYAEAKENFTHCVENMPEIYRFQSDSMLYVYNISGAYNSLGFCSYKQGDYGDALNDYALGEALLLRYLEEHQSGKSDENKPLYRRLAIIYNNIAAVYEDMGQTADAAAYALKAYRIVIEKELDMGDFQKLLQRMERLNISAE